MSFRCWHFSFCFFFLVFSFDSLPPLLHFYFALCEFTSLVFFSLRFCLFLRCSTNRRGARHTTSRERARERESSVRTDYGVYAIIYTLLPRDLIFIFLFFRCRRCCRHCLLPARIWCSTMKYFIHYYVRISKRTAFCAIVTSCQAVCIRCVSYSILAELQLKPNQHALIPLSYLRIYIYIVHISPPIHMERKNSSHFWFISYSRTSSNDYMPFIWLSTS